MINQNCMKEKETLNYEAPQVEIIEVEVEQGFAASVDPSLDPLQDGGEFGQPNLL